MKKISALVTLLFFASLFSGCTDFFNFGPDPLIEDVETKEQALEFIVSKASDWDNVKARVNVSIIPLPLEGHIDFTDKKLYIEEYKIDQDKNRIITQYFYLLNETLYSCTFQENGEPEYKITSVYEEFDINVDINKVFLLVDKTSYNLEEMTFEKTENQLKLSQNFSDGTKTYHIDLIYKNNTIQIAVEGFATIIFEEDDPNYFSNLDIDLTPFEALE